MAPAICTQCGAKIEVNPSLDASICPYCGTAFVVEKAVKKYVMQGAHNTNVEHIDTVNINTIPQEHAGSALYFLDRHLDRRNKRKLEVERLRAEKDKLEIEKEKLQLKLQEKEEDANEFVNTKGQPFFILRFLKFLFVGIFKLIFWAIIAIVVLVIWLSSTGA